MPFLIIAFLNWRVFKTARILQGDAVATVQVGAPSEYESQQQEMTRRHSEQKTAVDVSIIIAAFLLCFLPVWITGLCRQFIKSPKVPAEVILSTTCIFFVSSLCNPIIYSIRKREFRTGVKKVLGLMRVCGTSNDINEGAIHPTDNPRLPRVRPRAQTCPSTAQQNALHIIRIEDKIEARGL